MEVSLIPALQDNYVMLLEQGPRAVVIDPGEAMPVLRILRTRKVRVEMILNTHHHGDHTGGNQGLKEETGARILGPDPSRIPGLDDLIGEGDVLEFGSLKIHVLATPGHTASGVSFYLPSPGLDGKRVLCTGDTLFAGGCGRLFECGPDVMWNSLKRLASLPDDTRIYCGHEYTLENLEFAAGLEPNNKALRKRLAQVRAMRRAGRKTVPSLMREEKATNPFLRAATGEMRRAVNMPGADDVEVFAEIRRRKDRF